MAVLSTPLRFEPRLRPMVWGGRLLERLGKKLPTAEAYGESWEVSDHPSAGSVVAEGPWKGATLGSLMAEHATDLLGASAKYHPTFPWLVKFLDARDWLSVQVHPDEESVKALWPGEGPKNEAWFVLAAEPKSWIYAGLLPGIGKAQLAAALAEGTVADCLYRFKPRPGDFLYMPAGTVHAVGGGVLLAEIQQTSDATFRLFDWNRKDAQGKARQLHVTESLAAIDWSRGPQPPLHVSAFDRGAPAVVPLLQAPYFELAFVKAERDFYLGGDSEPAVPEPAAGAGRISSGRLQAFCVFSGHARLAGGTDMLPGQVWVLPAAMAATECQPQPVVTGMWCAMPSPA